MSSRTDLSPYQQQLDSMTWSFSRVNTYVSCPKMFKMIYLDRDENGHPMYPQEENAFGLWGTLCHSCLEKYFKEELLSFELLEEYENGFDEVVNVAFPPNKYKDLRSSYYQAGIDYFTNFVDPPSEWETIGVEQKIELTIHDKKFIGYIDLLLRNIKSGEIVVVDHKSRGKFTSPEELEHYAYQPYLYSLWVKQKYGYYPTKIVFNMFRIGTVETIDFKESALNDAIAWFDNTVSKIYKDKKFEDKIKLEYRKKKRKLREYKFADFFCHYICGVRKYCSRSQIKKRGDANGFQ